MSPKKTFARSFGAFASLPQSSFVGAEAVSVAAVLRLGRDVQQLLACAERVAAQGRPGAAAPVDVGREQLPQHLEVALGARLRLHLWGFSLGARSDGLRVEHAGSRVRLGQRRAGLPTMQN